MLDKMLEGFVTDGEKLYGMYMMAQSMKDAATVQGISGSSDIVRG